MSAEGWCCKNIVSLYLWPFIKWGCVKAVGIEKWRLPHTQQHRNIITGTSGFLYPSLRLFIGTDNVPLKNTYARKIILRIVILISNSYETNHHPHYNRNNSTSEKISDYQPWIIMKLQRCLISLGNIKYSRVSEEKGWSEEKERHLKWKKRKSLFSIVSYTHCIIEHILLQ